MTQKELENYLWGAATLLRGVIDAGDYKQYIFPLLFYKRICDVYDEEYQKALKDSGNDLAYAEFAENHRFQIPHGSHWKEVRQVTRNVGVALQKSMQEIEKANPSVLQGIFGDASWTNTDRLSDEILIDLIEHFSSQILSIQNVPDDKLGDGYEFLIKKFADDSGHTAAEFYTNRTVVHLMTLLMDPQPGESVYDPTCGSGGMLLNCALELKRQGKEYRTLKLYGQEINLITSSIARMNMFLHGIEDFHIARGDTLTSPAFIEHDELKTFNVILANPPYSIKRWNRKMFENDPYGRNMFGTPPQGCADYAFQQHIIKSMDVNNGRCAILWPYGILFRDKEYEIRKKMIESDIIQGVIALGKNLFYNSPMEACILICNLSKPANLKHKIVLIDAREKLVKQPNYSYLSKDHINEIVSLWQSETDIQRLKIIVPLETISKNNFSLNLPLYFKSEFGKGVKNNLSKSIINWMGMTTSLKIELNQLIHEN